MRTITTSDPDFAEILRELDTQGEAVQKRRELSEESFRLWLYSALKEIATGLGYVIQNLAEFFRDMGDGFRTGFAEGRERARKKSIRARNRHGGR